LLVYDITRRETFIHLANWLTDARNLTNPQTQIIMVGNKLDLADQRAVSFEEATRFAEENNLVYLETSAKTGDNVEKAFLDTARGINERIENGLIDPNDRDSGVSLHAEGIDEQPTTTDKKPCCGM
jgi:Ras-related protein Rab-14